MQAFGASSLLRVGLLAAATSSGVLATVASLGVAFAAAPQEAREPGDFSVRVVDSRGVPVAGVPVALMIAREPGLSIVYESAIGDGVVRFRDCRKLLEAWPRDAESRLWLAVPGSSASIVIDPWQPPAEMLELVAPGFGRLEIALEDEQGQSVRGRGSVRCFAEQAPLPSANSMRASLEPTILSAQDSGLIVVEPFVIGARVRLDAWIDEYGAASVRGAGPTQAGETARIALRLGRHGPVLAGDYWHDHGWKPRNSAFDVFLHSVAAPSDVVRKFTTYSDLDGLLRLDLSKFYWELQHPPYVLRVEDAGSLMPSSSSFMPVPAQPGVHELRLSGSSGLPLLFAAAVLDGTGVPLAGTRVVPSFAGGKPALPEEGNPLWDLRTGSGDNGHCEARGITNGEPLFLQAFDGDSRASSPVRFVPGALDVRLFVRELGSLRGSIAVEPGVELAELAAFLRDSDRRAADTLGFFGRAPIASDGSFGWTRIPAGRYDVAIGFGLSGEALEVAKLLTDVEVRASAENRDARLDSMGLERTPRSLGIQIVDERGAPVPRGTVSVLAQDGHALCTLEWRDGEARVPGLDPALDVELRAPGRSTQRSNGVTDGAQLVLRPARRVRLSLEPSLEVVEGVRAPGLELVVTRTSARGDVIDEPRRVTLDATGAGELALEDSGTYRVVAALAGPSEGTATRRVQLRRDAAERFTEWFGRQEFTVPDAAPSGDLQRIALTLPLAARWAWEDLLRASR